MMLVRKSADRVRDALIGQDTWLTFGPAAGKPFHRFGNLELFREGRYVQREAVTEPRNDVEIITYVYSGNLAFEDSRGLTGVLHQGEFQRMTVGYGLRYSEMNISSQHEAHVFQFWLRPDRLGLHPGHEKLRFTVPDRRGRLRVVASPGGVEGSLSIHQDAFLYSAILATGQHIVHPIGAGRGAWIHVVDGSVTVGDVVLDTGDGAGVSKENSARILVTEPSEILLLDLGNFETKTKAKLENGKAAAPSAALLNLGDNGTAVFQTGLG